MFKLNKFNKTSSSNYFYCALLVDMNLWHERLGHISMNKMKKLVQQKILSDINEEDFKRCESCIYEKND